MNRFPTTLTNPPASESDLTFLKAWSPVDLPAMYLEFLAHSNGGHLDRIGTWSYIRFWPACTMVSNNQDYEMNLNVPGLIAFGDDGGPTFFAFDTRDGTPYPIVAVPFAPMQIDSAEVIASSFDEFVRG